MQIQLKISEKEIIEIVAKHINDSKILGEQKINADQLKWKYIHQYDETEIDGLEVDLPV